ncbi:hypothetical protein CBM2589_U10088 [Cupriavidus taiwanensis]|uniref:Uncharacterized protein n=1 Tax=Cupriavidus taiwanensis TaxID=164546 RepID=A0A375CQ81_9BURK|nr:hypothetical protein CBM2589_U10088 [Cupriavidus taiwanensis]
MAWLSPGLARAAAHYLLYAL